MNTKNQVKIRTKTYTTSELVSLCGATVDSISVLIREQNLEPAETGQSNVKYYDAGVLKQLRPHYAKLEPKRDKTSNTQDLRIQLVVTQSESQLPRDQLESVRSVIEILRNELKAKNSQIDKPRDLTNQAQQLDLATHTQYQEPPEQKSQPIDGPTKHEYGIFN